METWPYTNQTKSWWSREGATLRGIVPFEFTLNGNQAVVEGEPSYQPGGHLPFVEVHVMEHGLLMLSGAGVYRLEDDWYPVQAGDEIWMAPYCAQWFVAMGKTPARYLYYKDVNRPAI